MPTESYEYEPRVYGSAPHRDTAQRTALGLDGRRSMVTNMSQTRDTTWLAPPTP